MDIAPQRLLRNVAVLFSLSVAFLGGMQEVFAQEKPVIGTRTDLTTKLTDFLKTHKDVTSGTQTFTYDGTMGTPSDPDDDLYLFDPLSSASSDGCDQIGAGFNVDFVFDGNEFTMKRVLKSAGTISDGELQHELASDLNAWINAVWGMELKGISEFDVLGWQCYDGTTYSDNRFYTAETKDPAAVEAIKVLTGEYDMRFKWYNINGTYLQGDQILKFHMGTDSTVRRIRYMTDRGDPNVSAELRDTVRLLANAYIEISLPGEDPFELLIQMHTSQYLVDHCTIHYEDPVGSGTYVALTDEYSPDPNRTDPASGNLASPDEIDAGDIRIMKLPHQLDGLGRLMFCGGFGWFDPLGDPMIQGHFAENTYVPAGYFDNADSASKRMFRYVREHRGDWTYNKDGEEYASNRVHQLGRFRIRKDVGPPVKGILEFTEYYSDCCPYRTDPEGTVGTIMNDFSSYGETCEVRYCRPTWESDGMGGYQNWDGEFVLSEPDKTLVYDAPNNCPDCEEVPVPCLVFCDSAVAPLITATGVIQTDARTFTDRTPLVDEEEYGGDPLITPHPWLTSNDFERGLRGDWRVSREYVFRTGTTPGTGLFPDSDPNERNYNDAGVYTLNYFNWQHPDVNVERDWLNTTGIERYSHNGEPAEEVDIFDIPSTAHFGYGEQLPILVAKNATYNSVFFESFEDGKGTETDYAHSGDFSFEIDLDQWTKDEQVPFVGTVTHYAPVITSFEVDEYAIGDETSPAKDGSGLLIRFWAKPFFDPQSPSDIVQSPISLKLESGSGDEEIIDYTEMRFVAKTGEWGLFEAVVDELTSADLGKQVEIKAKSTYVTYFEEEDIEYDTVWIDDFRVQPRKSEMVCYVYDRDNFRQIAQFDDQHFGLFFQYNGEGKLARRLRETERGMKTVQEAQYNTPLIERDYGESTIAFAAVEGSGTGSSFRFDVDRAGRDAPTFDLLDARISLKEQEIKILGDDPEQLEAKLDKWQELLRMPELESVDLPGLEKIRLMEELNDVTDQLDSLKRLDPAKNDREEELRRSLREENRRRQLKILSALDLTDEEAEELLSRVREAERGSSEKNEGTSKQTPSEN